GLKKLIHSDLRMIEKPIRRSGLGPALTCLRQVRLRTLIEVARQSQKPSVQSLVNQLGRSKLLLCPIVMLFTRAGRGLFMRLSTTENFTRLWAQLIHIHIFGAKRKCFLSVLSSPPRSLSHIRPIGSPIRTARKTAAVHKGLQQHRLKTITLLPIRSKPAGGLPEHMARQVLHFDPRQNQKATIRDHLVQIFFPRSIAPTNPLIARLNAPGRGAESQPSQPLPFSALDQIAQLRSAKRPRAQIMITLHQLVPAPSCLALSASDFNQLHRPQFSQATLDRLGHCDRPTPPWAPSTPPTLHPWPR